MCASTHANECKIIRRPNCATFSSYIMATMLSRCERENTKQYSEGCVINSCDYLLCADNIFI